MAASKARSPRSKSSGSSASALDPAASAWDRAVRLLVRHDRSAAEIRSRLAALEIAPAVIERTIRRLHELSYLDERRFAFSAAEQAAHRGRGSDYVRAQLMAKGVAETLIEDGIAAAFDDETQLARTVLARRYPDEPRQPAERAKAARFLHQRGFPEAVVLAILEEGC